VTQFNKTIEKMQENKCDNNAEIVTPGPDAREASTLNFEIE
jgi:hypothetical protein